MVGPCLDYEIFLRKLVCGKSIQLPLCSEYKSFLVQLIYDRSIELNFQCVWGKLD